MPYATTSPSATATRTSRSVQGENREQDDHHDSCTALPGGADLTGAGRAAAGAGRPPRGPLRGSTGMSPAEGQVFVHHPGITVTA